MRDSPHLSPLAAICVLTLLQGCSSSDTQTTLPDAAPSQATDPETNDSASASSTRSVTVPDAEQGLTDEQISEIVAENRRVLGAMPETDEQTQWKTISSIKCPANEEIDQTFTADSTWRIRWVSGGNCVVRTTPIDAYNGWYAFGGLSRSQPTTKPNKNPGKHSVNVSLCFSDCELVVEQAAK